MKISFCKEMCTKIGTAAPMLSSVARNGEIVTASFERRSGGASFGQLQCRCGAVTAHHNEPVTLKFKGAQLLCDIGAAAARIRTTAAPLLETAATIPKKLELRTKVFSVRFNRIRHCIPPNFLR